jgi:hypothetical protein
MFVIGGFDTVSKSTRPTQPPDLNLNKNAADESLRREKANNDLLIFGQQARK